MDIGRDLQALNSNPEGVMVAGISNYSKDANVLISCLQSERKELLVEETGEWFLDKCLMKKEAKAG